MVLRKTHYYFLYTPNNLLSFLLLKLHLCSLPQLQTSTLNHVVRRLPIQSYPLIVDNGYNTYIKLTTQLNVFFCIWHNTTNYRWIVLRSLLPSFFATRISNLWSGYIFCSGHFGSILHWPSIANGLYFSRES